MYRTQIVILNRKKQSAICSYFDEWSLTSKAIYNSALFIERQLISSSGKSESMYSENEKEVRSLTREMISATQMTVGYAKLEKIIRMNKSELFKRNLPNQSVQHCLKAVVHDIKSYFESLKQYKENPLPKTACLLTPIV